MSDTNKAPTRMSKQELHTLLLSLGCETSSLVDKDGKPLKRPDLLAKVQNYSAKDETMEILETATEEDDEIGIAVDVESTSDDESDERTPPCINDPEWTQYVLGKFMPDEVDGQYPRVEGLRRMAGELIGELIEEGCDLVASPTAENGFRACAKAWGIFFLPNGITKRFEALADAHEGNCLEDYATHLVAMADTRAKGRMFRNALCLRRVLAAEEVTKTMASINEIQKGGSIHTGQISLIRLMADRNKLSIPDILNKLGITFAISEITGDVDLTEISYEDAVRTAVAIRELKEQTKENGDD